MKSKNKSGKISFLSLIIAVLVCISCINVSTFALEDNQSKDAAADVDYTSMVPVIKITGNRGNANNPKFFCLSANVTVSNADTVTVKKDEEEPEIKNERSFTLNANDGNTIAYTITAKKDDITVTRDFRILSSHVTTLNRSQPFEITCYDAQSQAKTLKVNVNYCWLCGELYGEPSGGGTNHTYEYSYHRSENCTQTDTYTLKCTTCNTTSTVTAPERNKTHNYEFVAEFGNGNCTTTNTRISECTICGDLNVVTIPSTNHSYGDPTTVSPTCTSEGYTVRKCQTCGYEDKTNFTAKIPHNFVVANNDCTANHVCSICGETQGNTGSQHKFTGAYKDNGDGTHSRKCVNNGCEVYGDNTAHTYGSSYKTNSNGHWQVCTVCNAASDVVSHFAENDDHDCTTPLFCSTCGYQMQARKIGHSTSLGSNKENLVAVSEYQHREKCSEPGCEQYTAWSGSHTMDGKTFYTLRRQDCSKTLICEGCGYVSKGGEHSWTYQNGDTTDQYHTRICTTCSTTEEVEHTVLIPATCSTPAECEYCHEKFGSVDLTKHVGNTYIANAKAATETEEGYTGDTVCSSCSTILEKGEVIPKLPSSHVHNWVYSTGDEENHWQVCSGCGQILESSKDKHTYGKPTNNGDGTHTEACTVCANKVVQSHISSEETYDCTQAIVCTECNAVIAAALNHNFSGVPTAVENGHVYDCINRNCKVKSEVEEHTGGLATCMDKAVCSVCGAEYGDVDPDVHGGPFELRDHKNATTEEEGYTGDIYCTDCGEITEKGTTIPKLTAEHEHNWHEGYVADSAHHWHICDGCGNISDYEDHTFENGICTVCGSIDPSYVPPVEPDDPIEPVSGSLTVSNTVSGNNGDATKDFTFTVVLSDTTINGTYGDMDFIVGVAIFTLKHGESKTAYNLPAGITYRVIETEADQDGYITTVTGDSGTITAGENLTAVFVNNKEEAPNTSENPTNSSSNSSETPSNVTNNSSVNPSNATNNSTKVKNIPIKPAKVKKVKAVSKKRNALKLTWKKIKGAKGYNILIAKKKSFKKNQIILKKKINKNNKKVTIKSKKLKSGKKYFVRVRAYKTYKDTKGVTRRVNGAWSKVVKSAKIK